MAAICEICGKRPTFGKKVSRLGKSALKRRVRGRRSRQFRPNIQRVRVNVGGTAKHMKVCTSCIKAGKVPR